MSAPLPSAPDDLALVATSRDWPAGWRVVYVVSTGSTQDLAREALRAGAPSRTIYVADHQTAGRGRQGRRWVTPLGAALTFSVVFYENDFRVGRPVPHHYTLAVSTALVTTIESLAPGLEPRIKWPNDVLLGDRKVAGVLAESAWNGEQLSVVVGVGINVRTTPAGLAGLPTATSLHIAGATGVSRGGVLHGFVRHLDAWLDRPARELFNAWNSYLWGRGQRLRVRDLAGEDPPIERDVVFLGAEPDGAIRLRLADGREVRTVSAELIL